MSKIKEGDTIRIKETGEQGVVSAVNDDGSYAVMLTTSKMPITIPCIHEKLLDYISQIPSDWSERDETVGAAPMFGGLIKIIRPEDENEIFQLHVYTAIEKTKGAVTTTIIRDASKANYNKFYFDEAFINILKARLTGIRDLWVSLDRRRDTAKTDEKIAKNKKKKKATPTSRLLFMSSRVHTFNFSLSTHIEVFNRAMKYLWDKNKLTLTFRANPSDYYTITDRADEFDEANKDTKNEKIFEAGEYEYMRTDAADPTKQIDPEMIVRETENVGSYGSVTLLYPLPPNTCPSYQVYPRNMSNELTIKLFLSLFGEQERARITKELDTMVKDKASRYTIGSWAATESSAYVPELKYIFGSKTTPQVGEILETYAKSGDLSQLVYEVNEVVVKDKKKKTTVDMTGAGEYLTQMLS